VAFLHNGSNTPYRAYVPYDDPSGRDPHYTFLGLLVAAGILLYYYSLAICVASILVIWYKGGTYRTAWPFSTWLCTHVLPHVNPVLKKKKKKNRLSQRSGTKKKKVMGRNIVHGCVTFAFKGTRQRVSKIGMPCTSCLIATNATRVSNDNSAWKA